MSRSPHCKIANTVANPNHRNSIKFKLQAIKEKSCSVLRRLTCIQQILTEYLPCTKNNPRVWGYSNELVLEQVSPCPFYLLHESHGTTVYFLNQLKRISFCIRAKLKTVGSQELCCIKLQQTLKQEQWTHAPREDKGFSSCKPLVTTLSANN